MTEARKIAIIELPPKYGEAPTETLLLGRNNGTPSSWLNVEGYTSIDMKHVTPSYHRSASDFEAFRKNSDTFKVETIVDGSKGVDIKPTNGLLATASLVEAGDKNINPNMDPKKIKRILANRLSAQKSRARRLGYISELEKKANTLQAEVNLLSPQVAYYEQKRAVLEMENNVLKQRISHLNDVKDFKEAQFKLLKEEKERLSKLYKR